METPPIHEERPPEGTSSWTDEEVEQRVGNLLRVGVLSSAAVVAFGAAVYLLSHGREAPHYGKFEGEPRELRSVALIIRDAISGDGAGIIQLGVLLLIATPVSRVMLAAYAFLKQRDFLYVAVSLVVLAVLTISLMGFTP